MGKVTVLTRRKVEALPEQYGVDLAAEETGGRLVQHVEGLIHHPHIHLTCSEATNLIPIQADPSKQGRGFGSAALLCTVPIASFPGHGYEKNVEVGLGMRLHCRYNVPPCTGSFLTTKLT